MILLIVSREMSMGMKANHLSRALAADVLPSQIARRPKRGFGAPARLLPKGARGSSPGFRQARYLSSARAMLDRWMAVA